MERFGFIFLYTIYMKLYTTNYLTFVGYLTQVNQHLTKNLMYKQIAVGMVVDVEDDINSHDVAMKLQMKFAVTPLDDYQHIDENSNENFVVVFGKTGSGVVEIGPQIRILCFLDFPVETLPARYKIYKLVVRRQIQQNFKSNYKKIVPDIK